jgi:prepilin peptidase CpaA
LPAISSVAFAALSSGALVATVIDIRVRRIPNALTATMAGIGVGLAASGVSGISLGASIAGFMVGLLLMLPGHALGATGAGDVKFMAAVGAIVGPPLVVSAFLFTAIAGGVLALAVALRRKRLGVTLAGTGRLITAPTDAKKEIKAASPSSRFAYGPAIAIGSVLAALMG